MLHTKSTYKPAVINYDAKRRPSKTVPNQSLSIKTIMDRFTRGIPVDAVKRQGTYIDQDEYDLEKLANAGFDEKARMAELLKDQNDLTEASILEARAQAQREAQEAARQKETRTGIRHNDDEGGGSEDGERVTQPPKARREKRGENN